MALLTLASLLLCVQDGAKLDWKKDYAAALKEAQKGGRYLIVHFSGPDCPSCKLMDETTYANAAVIERSNKSFVNVSIYLDGPNALARKFGIEAIPTTFLVTGEGERVRKWEGYVGPDDYKKGLDRAVEAHKGLKELEAKLQAEPDSLELHREAGGRYEALGRGRAAADAFKKAASKSPEPKGQAGLIARALGQLYEIEVVDALNDEILELAAQLEKLDAEGKLGFRADATAARAQAAMNKGKMGDAIKLFEEIVEKHPASGKAPVSLLWLADLYHHHQKNNAKAEKALQQLLERYPKSDAAEDAKSMLEHLKAHAEK
jgi:thioredoxin-related protein